MLSKAIDQFYQQTYPNKELVVCYDVDDLATKEVLDRLDHPDIIQVVNPDNRSLGAKRNLAVSHSTGNLIACWDDDDWNHPERLETQISYLEDLGCDFCVLTRGYLYDTKERKSYMAIYPWGWLSCSLISKRHALLPYYNVNCSEDAQIHVMMKQFFGCTVDLPELYAYISHGTNTYFKTVETPMKWLELKTGSFPWET
jgi:glycosyltransferase involved in cell wall biosynthesis